MDFSRLIQRLIRLFIKPREYWDEVVTEPGDLKTLLMPQMLILAGVPAVTTFLGAFFGTVSWGVGRAFLGALVAAVLTYIFQLAIWVLFGVIINTFAGVFGGQQDFEQSLKLGTGAALSVYAGSVLSIIPVFGMAYLGLFAGYGYAVYLLIQGFPIMSGVAPGKAIGYAFCVVGIMLAIAFFLFYMSACSLACVAYG